MANSFTRWFRGLVASDNDPFPPVPEDHFRYPPNSAHHPSASPSSSSSSSTSTATTTTTTTTTTAMPSTGYSSAVSNPSGGGGGSGGAQHRHQPHHNHNPNQPFHQHQNTMVYSSASASFSASVQDDLESIGLLREASTTASAPSNSNLIISNSNSNSNSNFEDKHQQQSSKKKSSSSRCDINLALFGLEDSGKSTLIKHLAVIQQQLRGSRKKDDRSASANLPSGSSNSALLLYKNDIVEYLLHSVKEIALSALIREIQMSDDHNNSLLRYFATSDPSEVDMAASAPTQVGSNSTDVGAQIATLWNDVRLRHFFVNYWKYSPASLVSSGQTPSQDTEMKIKSLSPDTDVTPDGLIIAPSWPYNAEFFLDSAQRIMHRDYVPTMQDVLLCKTDSTLCGQADLEVDYNGLNFRIIDVGNRTETRPVSPFIAIVIIIPLDDYDLARVFYGTSINTAHTIAGMPPSSGDSAGQRSTRLSNRLLLTYQLFDEVCNSNWGIELPIILVLNKADRFARKIQQQDLSVCFPDYKDGKNYSAAIKYIVTRFARLNRNKHRSIYYNITNAISPQDVTGTLIALFNCLREIILYNNLRDTNII